MTIGLVLGAGGPAGEAFHRGVIRAMDDIGLDPRRADIVVGTSAGSMVAASLRRGSSQVEMAIGQGTTSSAACLSRSAALTLVRRPRQLLNAAPLAPEFLRSQVSTDFIAEALSRRHGWTWPADPLWIVAVRRKDGARVIFRKPGGAAG
jgi:NTE family protein